jgi:chromosomal replication initiator protein
MLTKEKINAIHALLENEIINTDEYVDILNVLNKNGNASNRTSADFQKIISTVADYYGVSTEQLLSRKREPEIVRPRQVAMYISQKRTNMSHDAIGTEFERDHSAVIFAIRRISTELASDKALKTDLEAINERLGA